MNDNLFRPLPSPTHEPPATLAEFAPLAAATILDVGRHTGVFWRTAGHWARNGRDPREPAVHVHSRTFHRREEVCRVVQDDEEAVVLCARGPVRRCGG